MSWWTDGIASAVFLGAAVLVALVGALQARKEAADEAAHARLMCELRDLFDGDE